MNKRILIIVSAIAAALALYFLFQGEDQLGGGETTGSPLVIAFENDVVSLDPIRMADVYSLRVASQIYEGLTRLDANNQVVPAIAESWEHSDDLKTWTFNLRPDVQFHTSNLLEGTTRQLTAEDVVYSFTRMLSKDAVTTGPLASVLEGAKEYQEGDTETVEGIRTIAPNQVEFTLSRADALFPGRISSPAYGIVKQAVVDGAGSEFGQTVAVGTGPYRFVRRNGNDLVLEKNQDYWGDHNGIESVVFRTIKEDTVRLAEARNGRLAATYATAPMLPGIATRESGVVAIKPELSDQLKAESHPVFNTNFLALNWPKLDPNLRRAIALGVDRSQIVQAVVPFAGIAAADPIPVACIDYESQVDQERDLPAAKKALQVYLSNNPEATARITIHAHELAQSVPTSEVLQSQLAEVGIEVEIVQQSFNSVVGLLQKGDFEAVVIGFEYMYPKPELMLETYFTSAAIPIPNVFQYAKPENDEAIAKLFEMEDSQASLKKAAEIANNLVEDHPGVFLYQTQQVILLHPDLKGIAFNGANLPILTETSW